MSFPARTVITAIMAVITVAWSMPSQAGDLKCVRRDRKISLLDKDDWSGNPAGRIEMVRSFDCGGTQVEFLRISEFALALIEAGASRRLAASIGSVRLADTFPLQRYRALRQTYGTQYAKLKFDEELPYWRQNSDSYPSSDVTVILDSRYESVFYPDYFPAVDDMLMLSKGLWPKAMKMFVSKPQAVNEYGLTAEGRYPVNPKIPMLWRSLTASDLLSMPQNAQLFRTLIGQQLGEWASGMEQQYVDEFTQQLPMEPSDRLSRFLADVTDGDLPDELVRIQGWHANIEEGCATGFNAKEVTSATPRHFVFNTFMPRIFFDAILVRNTSKNALQVNGFTGSSTLGRGVHRIDEPGDIRSDVDGLSGPVSIGSGETVIFPTTILLRPKELYPCCDYIPRGEEPAVEAVQHYARFGYDISPENYQPPAFPLYFQMLPAYSLSGLETSAGRMSFNRTRPLRLSFTATIEEGSCPYLMTRSSFDGDGLWTDHGKILHTAASRDLRGVHMEHLHGAPRAYRIEEREPEIAAIDWARLTVIYDDGSTAAFYPGHEALQAQDGRELHIGWGEALEFTFPVRDSPDRRSPRTSRLEIAGYYERLDLSRLDGVSPAPRSSRKVHGTLARLVAMSSLQAKCTMPDGRTASSLWAVQATRLAPPGDP